MSVQKRKTSLGRYAAVGAYPMVQSFCPGHGIGHMVFMHRGEPILGFCHRRVHEWPPEGGFSTECESLPVEAEGERFDRSVALLQAIGWDGPAMVEYRYDPATDNAVLMEINGRFWGSLPLAFHAGAPFVWFAYSVMGLGRVPPTEPYRSGLVCRFLVPEARRLWTVLFRRDRIQNRSLRFSAWREAAHYLLGFFHPRTRYYVLWWRDPWPFFADGWSIAGMAVAKLTRPVRRRLKGGTKGTYRMAP